MEEVEEILFCVTPIKKRIDDLESKKNK